MLLRVLWEMVVMMMGMVGGEDGEEHGCDDGNGW